MVLPNITRDKLKQSSIKSSIDNNLIISNHFFNDLLCNYNSNDLEINTCIFSNIQFIACKLEKAYFVDVIFENCDLSNISFEKSTFKRVVFKDCKLYSANLRNCYFENVTFENNNMKTCFLDNSIFTYVNFNNCNLEEANLCNITNKKTNIENTNLSLCNFSKTSLKDIDLTSDKIDGIITYMEDLRGAIMNEYQALQFINILGIKIKDI